MAFGLKLQLFPGSPACRPTVFVFGFARFHTCVSQFLETTPPHTHTNTYTCVHTNILFVAFLGRTLIQSVALKAWEKLPWTFPVAATLPREPEEPCDFGFCPTIITECCVQLSLFYPSYGDAAFFFCLWEEMWTLLLTFNVDTCWQGKLLGAQDLSPTSPSSIRCDVEPTSDSNP